jgi:hypothetical protein
MSDDPSQSQSGTASYPDFNHRQARSTLPPASASDTQMSGTHSRSRSDNRPGTESPTLEKLKEASKIKAQSDLLKPKAPSRGPAGIQPKWKNVTDPLKPQPIRSYDNRYL